MTVFCQMRRLLAVTVVALAACRDSGVKPVESRLRFSKELIAFDPGFADGRLRTATVEVINEGKSPLPITLSSLDQPFGVTAAPETLPPGAATLELTFRPTLAGHFERTLTVSSPGVMSANELIIEGSAREIPPCEPSNSCVTAAFDVDTTTCVETPKPNGIVCDPRSVCVTAATCQEGRCIGTERRCDDGNKCTVDVCNATNGCEFLPAPPCPGDGLCRVGVCDPDQGCGLANARDGLSCGQRQDCQHAEVCIEGECVVRDPPEGFICAEASPCQGAGHCEADACVRPAATTLNPSWTFDSTVATDAGAIAQHDLLLEESGQVTLSSFFASRPVIRANAAAIPLPSGSARRCIFWSGRLVCADYPSDASGRVSAVDPSTGLIDWSFDVKLALPALAARTQQMFLARLVEQGSDRLAAVFEAYPKNPLNQSTQCRAYFLVVLDARGQLISGQQVTDPLLEACNHPHPYGVAADSVGNLFLAFSPTTSMSAPLKPGRPTLLMSFTHDGVFRWKRTDSTMVGGELAVARGLLYPENSTQGVEAATGTPSFTLGHPLGRAVVAGARLITSPLVGAQTIDAYEAGQSTLKWTHTTSPQAAFVSEQLRLASWATSQGTQTVALTFVALSDGSRALHAINVRDGSEAFTCAVNQAGAPQLFEVANGSIAIMEGAVDADGAPACSKCDPPFAGSAARFHTVSVPGISVSHEPWVGTFGGAGHDHREESPALPPF